MKGIYTGHHVIEERIARLRAASRSGEPARAVLMVSREESRVERLVSAAHSAAIDVRRVKDDELTRIAGRADHRGAVLVMEAAAAGESLAAVLAEATGARALALVVDGVTDPHNLGAVLRSADQFGVDFVVLPERRSAHENDTVARSAAGADAYVRIVIVPNLVRAVEELKAREFWIYGAAMSGRAPHLVDLTGRVAIVMGSEGKGLSRLLSEHCDAMLGIPTRGHIDSLNVSVAAGILLYEARRQETARS